MKTASRAYQVYMYLCFALRFGFIRDLYGTIIPVLGATPLTIELSYNFANARKAILNDIGQISHYVNTTKGNTA